VYSSTVKINERFGTAIAIWVFSIRSYSLTKRFIAASRSQFTEQEKLQKRVSGKECTEKNHQNRQSPFLCKRANRNLRKKLGTS